MVDSEPKVKASGALEVNSESIHLTHLSGKLPDMPKKEASNRDTVLSDFLRLKIEEWVKSGREQKDLAAAAGFRSPSTVAMVKRGQGVGKKTVPGFAKAFGFASVEALVDAAYEWRRGLGESLERRLADPAFVAAVRALGGLIAPPATDAEIRTIAADFVGPRFDEREADWWLNTIGPELKRDRMRLHSVGAEKREARRVEAGRVRFEEGVWREASRVKAAVVEAQEELAKRAATAAAEVEKKPRKKAKLRAV